MHFYLRWFVVINHVCKMTKKKKKTSYYLDMQCPFTVSLSCLLEYGSGGGLVPIFIGGRCGSYIV